MINSTFIYATMGKDILSKYGLFNMYDLIISEHVINCQGSVESRQGFSTLVSLALPAL